MMAGRGAPLYFAAAAATAAAGALHLMLGPGGLNFNPNQSVLFIVGGIAQVFWIIPIVRRWGVPWYITGIGGTAVFMAIFFITRVPGNPITGRGAPANQISIAVEVLQGIFIALCAVIVAYEARAKVKPQPEPPAKRGRALAVLGAVVIGLILFAAFALPSLMPSPMRRGPGPGQGPGAGGPAASQSPAAPNATRAAVS